jgi:hypothetical protein
MAIKSGRLVIVAVFLTGVLAVSHLALAQPQPANPEPLPDVPKGVEVQARGPVHEAFATPTAESKPTPPIPKKPPAPIEEMPPAEKPAGTVAWIGGYWAFDDDRQDFLWVSGCWRTLPAGRSWIPGYWREAGDQASQWQWVPGFWSAAQKQEAKTTEVTYQPEPPALPPMAPPGPAPEAESFYVPGHWFWADGRYLWRPGYWARVQPGYVWVPPHYRWTPSGYVFIPGYWDYALARRGILYAPVIVDATVVGAGFVYTPAYAVPDGVIVDAFWVRPACCHYYFGDYYGPVYHRCGYVSCVVYSRDHYDGIVVYRCYEHRDNPRWHETQINIYVARDCGRAPCPPRTLREQTIIINNQRTTNVNVTQVNVIAPTAKVAAAQGIKTVAVPQDQRLQARVQAQDFQKAAVQQRLQTEAHKSATIPTTPRTAALQVPVNPAAHHTAIAGTSGQQPGSAFHPGTGPGPGGVHPGNITPGVGRPPTVNPGQPGVRPGTVLPTSKGPVVNPKLPPPPPPHPPAKDDKKGQKPPP